MDWNACKAACHQAVIDGMVGAVEPLADRVDLAYLRYHWGDAYAIVRGGRHSWSARRRDGLEAVLKADSADDLLKLIRLDYQEHPVSR